jgi:hypothetical protein
MLDSLIKLQMIGVGVGDIYFLKSQYFLFLGAGVVPMVPSCLLLHFFIPVVFKPLGKNGGRDSPEF